VSVAVLNDIHGNLPALQATLAEIDGEPVQTLVCGGDVLWGPYQSECLTLLRERGAEFLGGNTDREVLGGDGELNAWCRSRLSDEEREFVSGWPFSIELAIDGVGVALFCHASPRSDTEILTFLTPEPEVRSAVGSVAADAVVVGHVHQQFDRRINGIRVINAGSVGLPYEGRRGAFWTRLGPEVEFRCSDYDVERAAELLRQSGMPGIDELLADSLLDPVAPDEIAAFFERQAGRIA